MSVLSLSILEELMNVLVEQKILTKDQVVSIVKNSKLNAEQIVKLTRKNNMLEQKSKDFKEYLKEKEEFDKYKKSQKYMIRNIY